MAPASKGEAWRIYFYVPNLIGYVRVILALVSIHYALTDYVVSGITYTLSHLLDAADGYAARKLGQSSTLGAVLDMVSDRLGTAGLLLVLSHLYREHLIIFGLLLYLDIGSHWFHMYTAVMNSGKKSHKEVKATENWLLHLYYKRPVLTFLCLTNELFFVFLYLRYFEPSRQLSLLGRPVLLWHAGALVCAPFCVLKQYISAVQFSHALRALTEADVKQD
eukprot:tig00021432_g21220.t1